MIRFRVLLIAAGYPDANDCDSLRSDPAFKMALGRPPESGADLCSQPTMSRLENLSGAVALKRMMAAMVELFCDSFEQVPRRIMPDIDDTEDRVHGSQELALFHAHYGARCFLPINVYEATTGKPVAVILRPGKTPDGVEVMLVLRHIIRRIRARWPKVDILVRGDSHYGRPEAMSWCERNRVGYVFGLAGNTVLLARVASLAEEAALGRVEGEGDKVRRYSEFAYAAKTWSTERQVIARIEASDRGADSRFIITSLAGTPRWLYEAVYCARGQAENLVKAHKLHLASDRTSCSRATTNQFRQALAAPEPLSPLVQHADADLPLRDVDPDKVRHAGCSWFQPAFTGTKRLPPVAGPGPRSADVQTWAYIKQHELQNRREILADSKLEAVLGKKRVTMFEMNKHLIQHLR
jgi:hypothetical protein